MQGLEGHVRVLRYLTFSWFYDFFVLTSAVLLSKDPVPLTLLSSFLSKEWEGLTKRVPCWGPWHSFRPIFIATSQQPAHTRLQPGIWCLRNLLQARWDSTFPSKTRKTLTFVLWQKKARPVRKTQWPRPQMLERKFVSAKTQGWTLGLSTTCLRC